MAVLGRMGIQREGDKEGRYKRGKGTKKEVDEVVDVAVGSAKSEN